MRVSLLVRVEVLKVQAMIQPSEPLKSVLVGVAETTAQLVQLIDCRVWGV